MLQNQKVHCRAHNSSLLGPIISQINRVGILPSYLLRFILISSSHLCRSSKLSLYFKLHQQNPVYRSLLHYTCYRPRPSRPLWLPLVHITLKCGAYLNKNTLRLHYKYQFGLKKVNVCCDNHRCTYIDRVGKMQN
jgi:hypothetical protein